MSALRGGGETELPKWLLPLLGGGRPGGWGRATEPQRPPPRSPSSPALTEGPAAPWGGLQTAVGVGRRPARTAEAP